MDGNFTVQTRELNSLHRIESGMAHLEGAAEDIMVAERRDAQLQILTRRGIKAGLLFSKWTGTTGITRTNY